VKDVFTQKLLMDIPESEVQDVSKFKPFAECGPQNENNEGDIQEDAENYMEMYVQSKIKEATEPVWSVLDPLQSKVNETG
jgi:hypothetical protein